MDHFDVITQLWNHLREAASLGNHEIVQKTVATADNHPQSSVALGHLHSIFEPVQLVCSGNAADDQRGIFFTSKFKKNFFKLLVLNHLRNIGFPVPF